MKIYFSETDEMNGLSYVYITLSSSAILNLENNDKVRDHCHLTGDYRVPAHSKCNINVTQKQSNFIPFKIHIFSNNDCHIFFKKLLDKKNDKVKFDNIPKTNEEYISVTYGCITFIDSYRFLSSSLGSLVISLVDNSNKALRHLRKEIVDNVEILNIVNELGEEDKTIEDLKKDYPNEIENYKKLYLIILGKTISNFENGISW